MSPTEPESEKPVQKMIRSDREKANDHWSVAFANRVKGRRQHFQRRVGDEADGVKLQRPRRLPCHLGGEPAMLINYADDRRSEHGQSNRRWDGEQKRQPHSAGKNAAKFIDISDGRAFRYQRQGDGTDGDAKNSKWQLHQTKSDVEPTDRAIAKTRCKSAIDQDIYLHCAGGNDCRGHQCQHGTDAFVAPLKIDAILVTNAPERWKLCG